MDLDESWRFNNKVLMKKSFLRSSLFITSFLCISVRIINTRMNTTTYAAIWNAVALDEENSIVFSSQSIPENVV